MAGFHPRNWRELCPEATGRIGANPHSLTAELLLRDRLRNADFTFHAVNVLRGRR